MHNSRSFASPSFPSRRSVRGVLLLAALLLLGLAFAGRAGAAVYWSNSAQPFATPPVSGSIGRANLDATGINQAFIGGVPQPRGVASDGAHLYWTNLANRSIGRSNLDGTGVNQNFITDVDSSAVAVDAAHVYWDTRDGSIGRANLDGTGVNSSFIPQVGAVFGVAVDRAHVYWSTFSSVGRANLDGTGANQNFMLFDGLSDLPCGVAVDAGHVYWANGIGTIGRANLDGTGANPNFVQAGQAGGDTCGVAVDSAHLYWAHSALDPPDTADGIGRANLDGTGASQTFIATPQPLGVAVDAAAQAVPASRVSIGDVRLAEGNAGQTAFGFTVSLDRAQAAPVTVGFATADGTATAPGDYAPAQGTVTFAPGETAKSVTVQVNGDTIVEPDETFTVNLSNATGNATIADAQAVGTIANDDQAATPPPVVTGVSPNRGPTGGGTAIAITGSGFVQGDTVVIGQGNGPGAGAIAATRVSVVSSTQITASTGGGARAGTWNLFVIAPGGTASQAVSGDQFTYTPALAVSTVSPNSGPIGGGTAIAITGSGFVQGDTVVIGQGNGPGAGAIAATTVSVVSSTQIIASTGGGARAGTWNLFVIAPGGTASQAVSGDQFTYTP